MTTDVLSTFFSFINRSESPTGVVKDNFGVFGVFYY
jgi:hypothetical protein